MRSICSGRNKPCLVRTIPSGGLTRTAICRHGPASNNIISPALSGESQNTVVAFKNSVCPCVDRSPKAAVPR